MQGGIATETQGVTGCGRVRKFSKGREKKEE